ncbi:ABC transporter substrate-binding protein [Iamia sp. SCSIO 61187]|uniref:ABC transporter substrate-binding protein n=1 Tax=Iamia sp. SCSIO 61187 TaxID=2722752 RepID=UPI001C62B2E5|nr:ABC transporter substrate-binding protein [Iamia sp. SCSIO 61187]QYG91381.1 ABC transporter substrate-binding protein [Iamia sp. SCSIO 61187]
MKRTRTRGLLALLAVLTLLAGACSSRDDDDSGGTGGGGGDGETEEEVADTYHVEDCTSDPTAEIEGDTLKVVSSYPQSGLTGAFAEIARGWATRFDEANANGGVDFGGTTVQIEYEDADDEYNPQQTASNIEELVGADGNGAFAVFSVVGTANNINIRDFLDERCVPNVFAATGSVAWGNPDYPWLIGSSLSPYTLEAQAFADYLEENDPDAKVGMLRQSDEFGATYEEGFRQAIEGTDIELVAVEEYPVGSDQVGSQVTSLAASGADAFFNGGTLLACPNALTAKQAEGWEATTWVSGTCISKTLMGIAGAAGADVLSLTNLKDPLNPEYAEDPAMTEFFAAVQEYQPNFKGRELDLENAIIAYGYAQADLFIQALEAAEAPTRLAMMQSIRNLDGITTPLAHEGITFTTSGTEDSYMGESFVLVQYDAAAAHFNEISDVIDFEGQTADLTPEELITA